MQQQKKILYVLPYCPYPIDNGPKNVTGNFVNLLPVVHAVDFVSLNFDADCTIEHVDFNFKRSLFDRYLFMVRNLVLGCHPILSKGFCKRLFKYVNAKCDSYDAVVFDYFWFSFAPIYLNESALAKSYLIGHDAYSLYFKRALECASGFWCKIKIYLNYIVFLNQERKLFHKFNRILLVSDVDKKYLLENNEKLNADSVFVIKPPLEHYYLNPSLVLPNYKLNPSILVVPGGAEDWIANVAVELTEFLLSNLKKNVKVIFWCPGLSDDLKNYLTDLGAIHVGYVADYFNFLNDNWIYVYPKRALAGFQTKLPQALACGLPLLADARSLAPLGGKDKKHYITCVSNHDYLNEIEILLSDCSKRQAYGFAGRKFVLENFTDEACIESFNNSISSTYE